MIGAGLQEHAGRNNGKPAIVCGNEMVKWRDLVPLVNQVSNWLDSNTPPRARIGLVLPNSAALPILMLAIARSGRVGLVFDPAWPSRTAARLAKDTDCALVISTAHQAIKERSSIVLDASASVESLAMKAGGCLQHYAPTVDPSWPFYIGFTSGSTGQPKGYQRSHRSWTESFAIEARVFGHRRSDIVAAPGSLSHSLFLYAAMHALQIGATIVLQTGFRPGNILNEALRHSATMLYAVPAQLQLLAKTAIGPSRDGFPSMRYIISSGSKWEPGNRQALRKMFAHARLAEFYGASELSFVSVAHDGTNVPAGSVGKPFPGVDVRISDSAGNWLAAMETGEIFVSSPMLFDGYVTGAAGDGATIVEKHMSVGDMGWLDYDGYLWLAGRKDRMIVSAGKNLFPEEVEAVLRGIEGIQEAAVVTLPDEKRGVRITAAIQLAGNTERRIGPAVASLITALRKHLPLYKIPRQYYRVVDWPRTRSGKTDFVELRNQVVAGQLEQLT